MSENQEIYRKQKAIFKKSGGQLRTTQALREGLSPRDLYKMRDLGVIQELSRGLFRLSEMPPLGRPDLVTVSLKIPQGVFCLLTALAIHELTTQIPHRIYLAIKANSEKPKLKDPPVEFYWFSKEAYTSGIETHTMDGVPIKVYGPEKTVADCFKYRNKIGLDVALEALKDCRRKKKSPVDLLMKYAKICRVHQVMRPYLEAIL